MTDAVNQSWIEKISSGRDGLYDKLSSSTEGWNIQLDGRSVDVPLGLLDASTYKILQKTLTSKKRVAIALPRVKTGVSLSIIAYLVVNRFLNRQQRTVDNFIPLSLNNGSPVIIATKNRKLRDFFLESGMRFNHVNFPFTFFPIHRLNRLGQMMPLVSKEESQRQIRMEQVIFYHFDSMNSIPQVLNKGYFIGEITETDSPNLALRLCKFVDDIKTESALVLINEFATNSLDILKDNGFNIITLTANDVISNIASADQQNLPSLESSLAQCPAEIKLKIELIEDDAINQKIGRINTTFLSINKKLGSNRPSIFLKAWSIFYALKDLSVPLDRLEQARKRDTWLKTISHNLEQLFNFPMNKLEDESRSALEAVWGSLEAEFTELYSYLKERSPKYDCLMKIVEELEQSDTKSHIIFTSQLQAESFKEELLLSTNWIEEESNIKVGFINDYISNSETCENIYLVGTWRKSDQHKILCLFPKTIHIVCYGAELPVLPGTLHYLNHSNNESQTQNALEKIGLPFSTGMPNKSGNKWIMPDNESQILIEHINEFIPKEENKLSPFDSGDWSLFGTEQEVPEEEELESQLSEADSSQDDAIPAYLAKLEDGRNIFIPTQREVYAYSDEDQSVQSKMPEALEPGDIILLYSEDQNDEMFQNVLRRTQELSGVDTKATQLWKTALKELRETYEIKNPNSYRAYLHDLRDNGCTKLEQTIRQWLRGTTMAPRDQEDIECLLKMIQYRNASTLSKIIHREIEIERLFHRKMGRRLKERLQGLLRSGQGQQSSDPIDREIDEILEIVEPVSISEISKEVKYTERKLVNSNIFG